MDSTFLVNLAKILALIQPYAAILLSLLAILELLVTAQGSQYHKLTFTLFKAARIISSIECAVLCAVGKITGNYYRILLDKDWAAFWHLTGVSALFYVAATFTGSTTLWLSEFLAVRCTSQSLTSL